MSKYFYPVTLLFTITVFAAQAQRYESTDADKVDVSQYISDVSAMEPDDYLTMELPTLSALLENARSSAVVEFYTTTKMAYERDIKSQQRAWLAYFKINASYSYGYLDMTTQNDYSMNILLPEWQYNKRAQHIYNVGVSFSLPLVEIFDRRNRVNKERLKARASDYEAERWLDEQNLKIIESYTKAQECLAILKPLAKSVKISDAQYMISEMDFMHGVMSAQELSRQKNVQTTTRTQYEQTRATLHNALLRLELLSRTRIIKR